MKRLFLSLLMVSNVSYAKSEEVVVIQDNPANDIFAAHYHTLYSGGFGRDAVQQLKDNPVDFDWGQFPVLVFVTSQSLQVEDQSWLNAYEAWFDRVEQQEQV